MMRTLLSPGALLLPALALVALVTAMAALSAWPAPTPARATGTLVTQVSAGGSHACATTEAGNVKCWGFGGFGQLGDGSAINRAAPAYVVGLDSGVAAVAPGWYHTCAVTSAGAAKCWGWNVFGQLGTTGVYCIPDDPLFPCSAVPVDVAGLESGVAAVSAGSLHSCALTTTGGVKCWGNNNVGELGDGTTISRFTPADVQGLTSGVVAIAAGFSHTCALTSSGAVRCWGDNIVSELGAETSETCISPFGDPHPCSTTPLDVETLDGGVAALSATGAFTCALTDASTLKCWGQNGFAELGDGTFGNTRRIPVDVCADAACQAPLSGVAAVAAGDLHTCALMVSSGVKCWGLNLFGEAGDGSPDFSPDNDQFTTPVDVCQVYDAQGGRCAEIFTGATAVAAGRSNCALTVARGVKCWGGNATGRLGIGVFDGERHPLPLDVIGLGPKPTATPTPTVTPTASRTATPTLTSIPTATSTASPRPSPPAGPESTPQPPAIATSLGVTRLPQSGAGGDARERSVWWMVALLGGAGISLAGCGALPLRLAQARRQ